MILYLYALADAVDGIHSLRGVGDERVQLFDVHGVRLAAGWLSDPPTITREALYAQDQVVRTLHERASALLPFRFGTSSRDLEAAAHSIDVIQQGLRERLDRVRGRDQMTVRVLRSGGERRAPAASADAIRGESGPSDGSGARYMRARAAARELPDDLERVFDPVRALVHATAFEAGRHAQLVGSVYHLIDRGMDAEYRAGLDLRASRDYLLRVSGPSPAYAFAIL